MSMSRQNRTRVMMAIIRGYCCDSIEEMIESGGSVEGFIDATDPECGITPLMGCAFRDDNADTIRLAERLIELGARIDTRDNSGPGVTPLLMAAQEGKPKLLAFLIEQGGSIDVEPESSKTQPLGFCAQNGHAHCATKLAEVAIRQGKKKQVLEAHNNENHTAAYVTVARFRPEVAGVLIKAGADMRFACPAYFTVRESSLTDPSPSVPNQFALNLAVRSYVSYCCAYCFNNAPQDGLKTCTKCRMARYCNADCQKKDWKMHKRCCKKLREGQDLFITNRDLLPKPPSHPAGFEQDFGAVDHQSDDDNYDRNTCPVWEYNAGGPGHPNWIRYPPRIEGSLESLLDLGSPRYMYKPGNEHADGNYEQPMTRHPPANVATRYVYYCDMLEREIYTGAARSVRRNGSTRPPARRYPSG